MSSNDQWELGREVRYFNGTLRKLRLEKGLRQVDVAKAIGINDQLMSHYETMRTLPPVETAKKLAEFFGVEVEDIFPGFLKVLQEKIPKKETKYAQLSAKAVEAYTQKMALLEAENSDPTETYRKNDIKKKIIESLYELSERQRKIICMKYGLLGEKPHSTQEIANEFMVSRSRMNQLEHNALKNLRMTKPMREVSSWGNLEM